MDTTVNVYQQSFACKAVRRIIEDLDETAPSALGRQMLDLLNSGRVADVLRLDMPDPAKAVDARSFAVDYLLYNLLRKSDFLDVGVDRKAAALEAFLASEETCRLINEYGYNPAYRQSEISPTSYAAMFWRAREIIAALLGPFSWDEAQQGFGFSTGASTRLPRKSGSPFYKYQGKPEVTPSASVLAVCEMWHCQQWRETMLAKESYPGNWVKLVRGSRAATVPKNWKTHRFICVEPDMNMYMQRGVGAMIRRRLKRVGIDLNDQTQNQRLAMIGSRTGSLATIDLKAASDSIALRLVEELLPREWFEALVLLRCEYVDLSTLGGGWHNLQKISSMGNGYTFELESLIFWALSKAVIDTHGVGDRRLGVYGDDIVIHASVAEPLVGLLGYCGFTCNEEKSFITGPFRESCGKHYFYGVDVSPFNIKEEVAGEHRCYWLFNTYREWTRRCVPEVRDHKLLRLLRKQMPERLCYVPPGFGYEAGIEVYADEANVVWSMRQQQYLFKALRPVRRKFRPNGQPALMMWLAQNQGELPSDRVLMLYKGDTVYVRGNARTSRWPTSVG